MIKFSNDIIGAIKHANNVAVFTHVKPDGDCIGCACALKCALEKVGKNVDIYSPTTYSEDFLILKGAETINKPKLKSYDLGIAVDLPDFNRLGYDAEKFKSISTRIKIDHHTAGSVDIGTYNFVMPTASTANLIYYLLQQLHIELDKDIASALYCGIATDTGCFMHQNVTKEEHLLAAKLMEYNIDYSAINYQMFVKKTLPQVNLIKAVYSNVKSLFNGKVMLSILTLADYKNADATEDDEKELINSLSGLDNGKIFILIKQKTPNKFIVGLRSVSEEFDVAKFSNKYFGGGGHPLAAGCTIFGTKNLVVNKIINALKEEYGWIS